MKKDLIVDYTPVPRGVLNKESLTIHCLLYVQWEDRWSLCREGSGGAVLWRLPCFETVTALMMGVLVMASVVMWVSATVVLVLVFGERNRTTELHGRKVN